MKTKKNQTRPIIEEFEEDIDRVKEKIPNIKPIPFRDDKVKGKIRDAFKIPVEYLRFRKDNGRIASDVITYESQKGELNETTDYGQAQLRKYLELKDPEKTEELLNSIEQDSQDEYAAITSDGFLINGNRRKMVMEKLLDKNPGDERYKYLNVVILPGAKGEEAPPTYIEIEQLENRYQFQRTGKAEYYGFDMALAIKRKMDLGLDLDEILLDDPNYKNLNSKQFKKKKNKFEEEYVKPLECIDRYLKTLDRPNHYNSISEKRGDAEGRWQAFLDYYNFVYKKLSNPRSLSKFKIDEDQVGEVENVAFRLIRHRDFGKNIGKKLHQVMRDIPKLLTKDESTKELLSLLEIDLFLPEEEVLDEEGNHVDEKTKDIIWGNKYNSDITWKVKNAYKSFDEKKEQETPLQLIQAALNKLNHNDMNIELLQKKDRKKAMKITRAIQKRANEIESKIYHIDKD